MTDNILDEFSDHVPPTSQEKPRSPRRIGRKRLLDAETHADTSSGHWIGTKQARIINRFRKPITLARVRT